MDTRASAPRRCSRVDRTAPAKRVRAGTAVTPRGRRPHDQHRPGPDDPFPNEPPGTVTGAWRSEAELMKALVYNGPGDKSWTDAPDPQIQNPTDIIVRIDTTTICGTDLHILKGDVPAVTPGRILGHEGVGLI